MSDDEVLGEIMTPDLQEKFEDEVFAAHRQKIMDAFGNTQADLDVLEQHTGYLAAREQADRERAAYLTWVGEVYSRLSEPMDPHVDLLKILEYLNDKVEWETLNSPEQAQVMDWRLR